MGWRSGHQPPHAFLSPAKPGLLSLLSCAGTWAGAASWRRGSSSSRRVGKPPWCSTTDRSPKQWAFSCHRSGDQSPSLSGPLSRALHRVLPHVTLHVGRKRLAGGSRCNVLTTAYGAGHNSSRWRSLSFFLLFFLLIKKYNFWLPFQM